MLEGSRKGETVFLFRSGGGAMLLFVLWTKSDTVAAIVGHYDMPLGFSSLGGFAGWFFRVILLAPLFSAVVMLLMPRCCLPLAFLGERTLPIYVFHAVFWPWEWQTRQWLVPAMGGKAASLLAMSAWLCVFLLPVWHVPLQYLQSLPSRLPPVHAPCISGPHEKVLPPGRKQKSEID